MIRLYRRRSKRKALSIVELMFTVTIMAFIGIALITLFLTILRLQKSTNRSIMIAHDSARLHRELRRIAASGGQIVTDSSGERIDFVRENGVSSALVYDNGDGDDETVQDNRVVFVRDTSDPDTDNNIVVNYASPLRQGGTDLPIFTRDNNSGGNFANPIIVQFRIGDRVGGVTGITDRKNDPDALAEDAFTGQGFQSLVFRGAYGPRNRF